MNISISYTPATSGQQAETPNLVKALTGYGMFAGFLICIKKVQDPGLVTLAASSAVSAGLGYLCGYSIHHSLLAVVDGVRNVTNGLNALFPGADNHTGTPTATSINQWLETNDQDNNVRLSNNPGNDVARQPLSRRHSV